MSKTAKFFIIFAMVNTVLVTGIFVAIMVSRKTVSPIQLAPSVATTAVTEDNYLNEPIVPSQSIVIDKIAVSAPIIALGLDEKGNFADPDNAAEVGWYLGSPFPGSGNTTQSALFDGHLTDRVGQPAVFADLDKLKVGDEIKIKLSDTKTLTYEVTALHNLDLEEIDLANYLSPTKQGRESLTIITCAGSYEVSRQTYNRRLIVQAVLT